MKITQVKQFNNKSFLKSNLSFALESLKGEPGYKLPTSFQSRIAYCTRDTSTSCILFPCFSQNTTNSASGRLTIGFLFRKIIQHLDNNSLKQEIKQQNVEQREKYGTKTRIILL